MGAGSVRWTGLATVAAGSPGVAGSVDVSVAAVQGTDVVVVTPCDTSLQTVSKYKFADYTFQVVVASGSGFTIHCNQKQNPEIQVAYICFTTST